MSPLNTISWVIVALSKVQPTQGAKYKGHEEALTVDEEKEVAVVVTRCKPPPLPIVNSDKMRVGEIHDNDSNKYHYPYYRRLGQNK